MAATITNLLHLFLDLYDRDCTALSAFLEEPLWLLDDLNSRVSARSQLELLLQGYKEAREEIRAKILLEASAFQSRHRLLRDEVSELPSPGGHTQYEPLPELELAADDLSTLNKHEKYTGAYINTFYALIANEHGLTVAQYKEKILEKINREKLAEKRIDSEILRFFADRLDGIINSVEQLDGTRFDLLIPEKLHAPFREMHMNATLGNFGFACILCGTLLERALQDLLPSKGLLNQLIKEAKEEGLLQGTYRSYADRIRDDGIRQLMAQ